MTVAVWIIAVCEVIRATQNMVQIVTIMHDTKNRDNAYSEFIKSLKSTDREFVKRMLEEYNDKYGE
ncbi:MAG: hypothetical protein IKO36_11275 [Bacteroidaceae bacterium]|nr:hypothetical protein [Bacteroidaceae bacterium]